MSKYIEAMIEVTSLTVPTVKILEVSRDAQGSVLPSKFTVNLGLRFLIHQMTVLNYLIS